MKVNKEVFALAAMALMALSAFSGVCCYQVTDAEDPVSTDHYVYFDLTANNANDGIWVKVQATNCADAVEKAAAAAYDASTCSISGGWITAINGIYGNYYGTPSTSWAQYYLDTGSNSWKLIGDLYENHEYIAIYLTEYIQYKHVSCTFAVGDEGYGSETEEKAIAKATTPEVPEGYPEGYTAIPLNAVEDAVPHKWNVTYAIAPFTTKGDLIAVYEDHSGGWYMQRDDTILTPALTKVTSEIESEKYKTPATYLIDAEDVVAYPSNASVTLDYSASGSDTMFGYKVKVRYNSSQFEVIDDDSTFTNKAGFAQFNHSITELGNSINEITIVGANSTAKDVTKGLFSIKFNVNDIDGAGKIYIECDLISYAYSPTEDAGENGTDAYHKTVAAIDVKSVPFHSLKIGETTTKSGETCTCAEGTVATGAASVEFGYDPKVFTVSGIYKYTGSAYTEAQSWSDDGNGTAIAYGTGKFGLVLTVREDAPIGISSVTADSNLVCAYNIVSDAKLHISIRDASYYQAGTAFITLSDVPEVSGYDLTFSVTGMGGAYPGVTDLKGYGITSVFTPDSSYNTTYTGTLRIVMAASKNVDLNGSLLKITNVAANGLACSAPIFERIDPNNPEDIRSVAVATVMGSSQEIGTVEIGDVNHDEKVNLTDLILVMQYLAGKDVTIDDYAANCDGSRADDNGDYEITIVDALMLADKIAKSTTA